MNDEYLGTAAPSNADSPQTLSRKIARGISLMTGGGGGVQQVSSAQKQYAGAPSSYGITTSNGTVFTLAAGEMGFIQNLATSALLVRLSVTGDGGGANDGNQSLILKAGTIEDDALGGTINIKDHIGAVAVQSASIGSPRFIAWKRAA